MAKKIDANVDVLGTFAAAKPIQLSDGTSTAYLAVASTLGGLESATASMRDATRRTKHLVGDVDATNTPLGTGSNDAAASVNVQSLRDYIPMPSDAGAADGDVLTADGGGMIWQTPAGLPAPPRSGMSLVSRDDGAGGFTYTWEDVLVAEPSVLLIFNGAMRNINAANYPSWLLGIGGSPTTIEVNLRGGTGAAEECYQVAVTGATITSAVPPVGVNLPAVTGTAAVGFWVHTWGANTKHTFTFDVAPKAFVITRIPKLVIS